MNTNLNFPGANITVLRWGLEPNLVMLEGLLKKGRTYMKRREIGKIR